MYRGIKRFIDIVLSEMGMIVLSLQKICLLICWRIQINGSQRWESFSVNQVWMSCLRFGIFSWEK